MSSLLRALVLNLCMLVTVTAADIPVEFEDAADRARYEDLLEQLRCLVCQNQSLADSNADLAQDLRNEVYRMVAAGAANARIVDFMVSRYGDFVLYKPPFKPSTWLLWLAPPVLVLAAAGVIVGLSRRSGGAEQPLTDEERERLAKALGNAEQ